MALSPDQRRRLLRMNMLMSYAAFASAKATTAWTPATLFANAEVGGWYDPSDLTTLFQDAAGTTPVTAVEQPVGLVLDKSKGLVLGAELITVAADRDFSSDTGFWTKDTGVTISGGNCNFSSVTNTTGISANNVVEPGVYYEVTIVVTSLTAGSLRIYVGGPNGKIYTAAGTYIERLYCPLNGNRYFGVIAASGVSSTTATIDSWSLKKVSGSHLSQSTSTARPVLSARVNLLTRTEEFDNAVWQISAAGVATVTKSTTNAGVAPDGTTTADRVLFNLNGGTTTTDVALLRQAAGSAGEYTFSIAVRSFDGTSSYVMQLIKPDGTGQNITVTGSWQRFTVSGAASGAINYGIRLRGGQSPANSDSADVLIWGADLRPSDAGVGLPAYQRVGAAVTGTSGTASPPVSPVTGVPDYDTTGFPLYLKFDGTDDSLSSASIDFTSTDKMSVFAGVRKLSDAALNMIAELDNDQTNAFSIGNYTDAGTQGPYYNFWSRGGIKASGFAWSGTFSAPITNVVTGLGNISGDSSILRVNGAQVASNTSDQGSGNYANASLFVGSRNNASLRFNGHLYSLIVRGAATDAATIASTETWVNNRTKAY